MVAITVEGWIKSLAGTPNGYPAAIAKGTFSTALYPYGGSFLSTDGKQVSYTLVGVASNGRGLAIGNRSAMWSYYSGTNLSGYLRRDGVSYKLNCNFSITEGLILINWMNLANSGRFVYCGQITIKSVVYEQFAVISAYDTEYLIIRYYYDRIGDQGVGYEGEGGWYWGSESLFRDTFTITALTKPIVQGDNVYVISIWSDGKAYLYSDGWNASGVDDVSAEIATLVTDMFRVTDAYWVGNISGSCVFSVDVGATWAALDDGDGSTNYTIIACDGTYIYATLSTDATTIIYRGTLDIVSNTDSVTWETYFASPNTITSMDASPDGLVIITEDTVTYLYTEGTIDRAWTSCRVIRKINDAPSLCQLEASDPLLLADATGKMVIKDTAGTIRFKGYILPSSAEYKASLEGSDRVLRDSMVNASFAAQTRHQIVDTIGAKGDMSIGTNNLVNATTFNQTWGAAMPCHAALATICTAEAAYYRTNIEVLDAYLIAAPNDSIKTITFGTTSAQLISEKPVVAKPINQLIVYGAYASTGFLQYTLEDANDQAVNGLSPLYVKRNDLLSYDLVKAFADELWSHRKSVQDLPYVFTVQVMGFTYLNCGDSITIANGSLVSDYLADGSYIILATETDLVRGIKTIEISTAITPAEKDYNDALPITAQVPVSTSNSASGNAIVQTSFASLLGAKWNDIAIQLSTGKLPASNYPEWAAFTTNTKAYKFGLNEYIEIAPIEILHGWVEGGLLKPHLHIVLSAATAQEEKLKFKIYYSGANMDEVAFAETTATGELTIPNATADRTHLLLTFPDWDAVGFRIGTIVNVTIKRVAKSAGGNELTAEPFVFVFGLHYLCDTIGSKEVAIK